MAKKTVRIVARETVIYDQEFEMTDAEIARIKAAMLRGEQALGDEVDGWLDKLNVCDSEPVKCDEVYVDGEQMYDE